MLSPTLQLSMAMTHGLLHTMSSATRICHRLIPKIFQEMFANSHVRKKIVCIQWSLKKIACIISKLVTPSPVNIQWFVPYEALPYFTRAVLSFVVPEGGLLAPPWYLLNWKSWNIQSWHDDRYAGCEGLCTKID